MAGIFQGTTPLNMGNGITAVYAGATKVWPAITYAYGIQACAGEMLAGTQPAYRSNNSISVTAGGSGTTTIQWKGVKPGNLGSTGTIAFNNFQTTWRGTWVGGGNSGETTTGGNLYIDANNTKTATTCGITQVCAAADDDGLDMTAVSVGQNGTILWSDRPGWSVTKGGTGIYLLTAPGPFIQPIGYGTVFFGGGSPSYYGVTPDDWDLATGTVRVVSQRNNGANVDNDFSFRAFLA